MFCYMFFGRSIFQGLSVIEKAFFVTFENVLLGMGVHAVEFFVSYFGVKKMLKSVIMVLYVM